MTRRSTAGRDWGSYLASVAIHMLLILLIPAAVSEPVFDVYAIDYAGVVEISSYSAEPASPSPAPGLVVQEEKPKPAAEEKTPSKAEESAPVVTKPVATKPTPVPKSPTVPPEAKPQIKPVVEHPEVITSPVGTVPVKVEPEPERPAPKPAPEPQPEAAPQVAPEPQVAAAPTAGLGKPDGVGTAPRPEFPGSDPMGSSMIRSTGGADYGVWIPKGVQNTRGRGEATMRVKISADGMVEAVQIVKAPPDSAMSQAIISALKESWQFAPDTTEGRDDSYYLDIVVGYDGGTGEIWANSVKASYNR